MKPGADSWDSLTRDLLALFDEPFMRIIVALLVFVMVLWWLSEVYHWVASPPESQKDKGNRRGSGDGGGKKRTPDRPGANDPGYRDPGTTRSRPPDRQDGSWRGQSGGSGSPPFGGATGEIGSIFKKDKGGPGASSVNESRSPWARSEQKDASLGRTQDEREAELPRFGAASGDAPVPPPRTAAPDNARLVLEAWRDAWASDVVSVRSLVDRMGQVPGVRGVNVLPESSVIVVRFDGGFLAVPSQQDYELCEKLFDADRPPGRFATVIDLERAAVVSGTNGEVVQRGMLRIECG